jgi:hypothetical protein
MFHFSGFAAAMALRATRLETLSHLWKAAPQPACLALERV